MLVLRKINSLVVQKTSWNGLKKFLTYLRHGTLTSADAEMGTLLQSCILEKKYYYHHGTLNSLEQSNQAKNWTTLNCEYEVVRTRDSEHSKSKKNTRLNGTHLILM